MNMPIDVSQFERLAKPITSYRPYWAKRFGTATFLPTSNEEMLALGWDSCDIVIVSGDAYVDNPSFGMAVIGRTLEAQGFRVGIIAQPDWQSAEPFKALGKPNLFYGVTAGNMDSMINRYTALLSPRSQQARWHRPRLHARTSLRLPRLARKPSDRGSHGCPRVPVDQRQWSRFQTNRLVSRAAQMPSHAHP